MKKICIVALSLLSVGTTLLVSCKNGQGQKDRTVDDNLLPETLVQDVESDTPQNNARRIYSCAFDGFLNIRKDASTSAEKVGKFNNGPVGAILLEELGEWIKIDVSGVVGYVQSKYVQDSPTIAYTGKADVNWIEGIWSDGNYLLWIYNNGTYEWGYDYPTTHGKYIMQNNAIKFIPTWVDPGLYVFDETLEINMSTDMLGEFRRVSFIPQGANMEEYEGSVSMTKADFKKHGRALLERVENERPLEQ